jgi:hypothetical protein
MPASQREEEGALHQQGALLTGVIALALLLVHFALGHVQQGAMAATIATTDARVAYEAQHLRQSVLFAHANMPGLDRDVRAAELAEGAAMGQGKGLDALKGDLATIRDNAANLTARAHGLEMAEAALQLAILLLAAGMAASSRWIMRGGVGVAGLGVVLAALAGLGVTLF